MATREEYKAVTGREVPEGKTAATELGDGGCFAIYKGRDKTEVIGRWTSWDEASDALGNLQKIGVKWEYQLEASHHWVGGLAGNTKCSKCGWAKPRDIFTANKSGMEWPA